MLPRQLSMVTPAAAPLWGSLVGTASLAATGHRPFFAAHFNRLAGALCVLAFVPRFFLPEPARLRDDIATALHGEVRSFSIPGHRLLQIAAQPPAATARRPGSPARARPSASRRRPPP